MASNRAGEQYIPDKMNDISSSEPVASRHKACLGVPAPIGEFEKTGCLASLEECPSLLIVILRSTANKNVLDITKGRDGTRRMRRYGAKDENRTDEG